MDTRLGRLLDPRPFQGESDTELSTTTHWQGLVNLLDVILRIIKLASEYQHEPQT
jgi:hypothetical protein